jgi:hypothetical protein
VPRKLAQTAAIDGWTSHPQPGVQVAQHRVERTAKETAWEGGGHRHIASLCLSDGARVTKSQAIADINSGRETYYTYAEGQVARVEVVDRCAQCRSQYLRTDRDTTTHNNLLELPDC